MNFNLKSLILFLIFGISFTNAQLPLQVEYVIENPENINNAEIEIIPKGGVPPYKYYWQQENIDTLSSKATGLLEGSKEKVIVKDSKGNKVEKVIKIPTETPLEKFNGFFVPLVNATKDILFFDVFSALGLHDNTVYAEQKLVPIPGWYATIQGKFILKKWYFEDGDRVQKGDKIATIIRPDGKEQDIYSPMNGDLDYRVKEGGVIYNSENKQHVIEEGAYFLAGIKYDNPLPLKNPNGTIMRNGIPFIVVWLVIGAIFFTLRMGFINIRGFKHSLQLASGKYDEPDAPGRVTHFQALATAVSGTVGLGNIAGVAVAISIGGAGATFWMIVAGFLGMSTKFVECTLGVKYREIKEDGRIFGGPMNYLKNGLRGKNMPVLGKVLATIFAILAVGASFGAGNMFQSNQAYEQLATQFEFLEGKAVYFGIFSAVLVGFVIIGGIKSIAKVTEKIVPFMAGFYVIASLLVIGMNIQNIGPAFQAIYDGAFSPTSLKGGILGVLFVGLQRASFSNEAGVGSAAIAHSAAKTKHPTSEGFVGLLEPFIDTVIICTLTALVLIFTGMHEVKGLGGAQLTSQAFDSVVSWFPIVLAFAIFLFAFSTMISWSYYGMRAWTYLFGKSKKAELIYKFIFLIFVVIGASISLGVVLDFSDMLLLAMAFPNILGLYLLSSEVKKDLDKYRDDLKNNRLFRKPKKVKIKKT